MKFDSHKYNTIADQRINEIELTLDKLDDVVDDCAVGSHMRDAYLNALDRAR